MNDFIYGMWVCQCGTAIPSGSSHNCHIIIPMDGLALQSPTPEQELPDLVGEMVALNQKVMDLETAKDFHMACIENLVDRLNEAEGKLKSIEEQFLQFIELRNIKKINGGFCGCEAIIDIETQHYKIIRGCQLHQEWAAGLCGQKKIKGTG